MSLILEALKKVERERTAPEQRGFLVLGPAAWAPARSNAGWILAIVAAAAVAGGVVYALTRPAASVPAAAATGELGPGAPTADMTVPPATMPEAARRERATAPRARPAAVATPSIAPVREPTEPALVLHAISEQDGVPIAVINGVVVREGQAIGGARVLRIGPAEVEVDVAGVRRIVRF